MTMDAKRAIFDHYRRSLEVARISSSQRDSLVCPLCWRETEYDQLSLEHVVPRSVGGACRILTCRRCNNDQGRDLDAHLSRYQKVMDAIHGHGTLPVELTVNGRRLVANLDLSHDCKKFFVVGKATNPAASKAVQGDFVSNSVAEVNGTVFFGYRKNNFDTAVLRAAYLVLFKCFGYEYARHEVVQVVRRRIADPTLDRPRLASLIIGVRNFRSTRDSQHYVVPGNINGVGFFLAIIRVRKSTTSYVGAYMPIPGDRCDEFFDVMEQWEREHDGQSMTIPASAVFG